MIQNLRNTPSASSPNLRPLLPAMTDRRQFGRRTSLPLKSDCLWRIEQGIVRGITWLEDGTVFALGIWGPGDLVGRSLSTLDPYQIECLTSVEVTPLAGTDWQHYPTSLLSQWQQLEELAVIRSHKRVEDALLRLLLWLARRFGREVERGHLLELRLTHQDLAELIGSTRVTITRALSQLEEQGLINRLPRWTIRVSESESWYYEI